MSFWMLDVSSALRCRLIILSAIQRSSTQKSLVRLSPKTGGDRPDHCAGNVTANREIHEKKSAYSGVVRGQKISPPNSTCSRRRTQGAGHGRQSPVTLGLSRAVMAQS